MDAFEAFITRVIKFRSLPLLPSRPTVPLPATSATTEPLSPTHATPDASQGVSQAPTEFDENDLPNDVYEQMMLDLERRDSGNSAGNSVPSAPTRLVLLDDLPYAHDKSQRARLAAAVQVCPHRLQPRLYQLRDVRCGSHPLQLGFQRRVLLAHPHRPCARSLHVLLAAPACLRSALTHPSLCA